MKIVCPGPSVVRGIDIYHDDLIQDITKVAASGVQYVFLKAYETSVDPSFAFRWSVLPKDGLIRGAYDFFHPERDPIAQAKDFCGLLGPLGDTDSCWLDWERTGGIGSDPDKQRALSWLQTVEAQTGKIPGIYTNPGFMGDLDARFRRYPLWISHYGVKCPRVPSPWNTWNFWQTSGLGSVPGMKGACDTDLFNGSYSDLVTFLRALKVSK